MPFNSIIFYAVFTVFLMVYAIVRQRSRVGMLCYVSAFSLVFFYVANARLFALLPCTAILSWALTEEMRRRHGEKRLWWMWGVVLLELFPLLYYKYTNFGLSLLSQLLQTNFAPLDIVLPIGISFYTFQAISYTVDVYRERYTERASLLEYFFYLTFFPLLLAGPITRAEVLLPQVRTRAPEGGERGSEDCEVNHGVNERLLWTGLWLIIIGLLKKGVVADYIAQYNDWVFDDPSAYSGVENLMAAIGYTVQIYCDFSGYSDMSIGLAALMGFELRENFRFPYQATSVADFWHRWHISLSTWFRDYVYIPLGGNRCGRLRTYFNNLLTMIIAGIWHGSTLMFVLWGALHGVALVVQKFDPPTPLRGRKDGEERSERTSVIHSSLLVLRTSLSWLLTMTFVIATFVVFRAKDMGTAFEMFRRILLYFDWSMLPMHVMARALWMGVIVLFFVLHAMRERHYYWLQEVFVRSPWLVKLLLFTAAVQLAIEFHSANVQAFIYTQF